MTLPIIILALIMTLALVYYEFSRRSEANKQQELHRRILGDPSATVTEVRPSGDIKQPREASRPTPEFLRPIRQWLAQAGLEMRAEQFLGITLLSGLAGVLLTALRLHLGIACLYGGLLGALPTAYVLIQRKRRLATFSQQLPYVADFLRSTLRAGHPLARGLQMATENSPEPMATELKLTLEQMRYGASLPDAFEAMFKRVPEESLGFFVAAVRVQSHVGSSLAEILDRVAEAIRARQRLQQQIKALTAQARMSGLMVGAMPFLLLVLFTFIRPDYTGLLFYDATGNKLLEAAIGMDLIALFVINRMVKV